MDVAAQNASLDNDYGSTKGPNAAAAHEVALFIGHPDNGGVEVSDLTEVDDGLGGTTFEANGYGRPVITNDASWLPASEGVKLSAVPLQWPDVTSDEGYGGQLPTHFVLIDAADHTTKWDIVPLVNPEDVTEAGPGPAIRLAVFYGDSTEEIA